MYLTGTFIKGYQHGRTREHPHLKTVSHRGLYKEQSTWKKKLSLTGAFIKSNQHGRTREHPALKTVSHRSKSQPPKKTYKIRHFLSARLRGRTATQRSKKGSEKVLGGALGKGIQKGSEKGACYGFYSKNGF